VVSGSTSTSSSHLYAHFPRVDIDLQHRSSNSIIYPLHLHIYAFTPIPLIAVEEMASANNERQNIPLRSLFGRPLGEALSAVDKPRQVTLPTQLANHKKSATYNNRIEKHHTNSRKRRGRASPDLDQQFAGNLSRVTVFTRVLIGFQMASKIPARRFVRRQTRFCPKSEAMRVKNLHKLLKNSKRSYSLHSNTRHEPFGLLQMRGCSSPHSLRRRRQ
jgi:hypothetical protein